MNYPKSQKYSRYINMIMGPNPVKLCEELLDGCAIKEDSFVMDLGSGNGLTSLFMAKEYGFRVVAADLWSNPTDVRRFFQSEGLDERRAFPIHADATELPFAEETFDAVVSTDSYNYFGRDPEYLGKKLLPAVKHGGYVYISIPGMKKDLHDRLPDELLFSWTPEQLDYIHDTDYWKRIVSAEPQAEVLSVSEMRSNEEVWNDWLACDNEYAIGDRKTMQAGGGRFLNFIKIVIRRK